jgi:cell division inhibitor SulA
MFSQAKEEAAKQTVQKLDSLSAGDQELPFGAQVILVWMLSVELLRKKLDAILTAMSSSPLRTVHHQQTLWDAIDQIVRIAWIGYLIYSYVHGILEPGFIILWVLTLIKAAQRVAAVELAKRSFAVGKNAHLVVGYVAQMTEEEGIRSEQQTGTMLLRKCWYPVMGEERLKRQAGPEGYRVKLQELDDKKDLVTVGDIWELAEGSDGKAADRLLTDHPTLKDLCLAFAFFKLLRARFQNFQVQEEVVVKNRDLIFRGLSNNDDAGGQGVDDSTNGDDRDGDDSSTSKHLAERAFHVIELELNFVMDYYHSVVPVVLCSPWFLVGNYLFVFLIVVNQAVIALVITGNGDLLPVIGCLARDVATLSRRAIVLFKCLGHKVLQTTIDLFSSFNILVSLLLFLTFLVMEAWEFVVYVLSDWLLVSLLCEYARRPRWQSSRWVQRAFCALLWVKRAGRPHKSMRFNQACILDLRRHTPWVFASLRAKGGGGEPLSNGVAVLHRRGYQQLLWACDSRSVTEVILVWHIATCLFEMKNSAQAAAGSARSTEETVAATLSKYCAYLVACAPELLPEDLEGSKHVYKAATRDLHGALRRKGCRSASEGRLERVMGIDGADPDAAATMGAELGRQLLEECDFGGANVARGWQLLAELWTELVVYIAPSHNIAGHAEALAQGGEFITLLWALATHTGIDR